jgi:hypothetical protein
MKKGEMGDECKRNGINAKIILKFIQKMLGKETISEI